MSDVFFIWAPAGVGVLPIAKEGNWPTGSTGGENLLRLRAVAENVGWDEYYQFRERQQHTRLYGQLCPEQIPLEIQAIDKSS